MDSARGWANSPEIASVSTRTERIELSMAPRWRCVTLLDCLGRYSHHKANGRDRIFPSKLQLSVRNGSFGESDFVGFDGFGRTAQVHRHRSEEHTSELQSPCNL